MTLSKKCLFVTVSVNNIQHKFHSAYQHSIQCHYAEYHDLFIVMPNVIMLSVVMLNVVVPYCSGWDKHSSLSRITDVKSFITLDPDCKIFFKKTFRISAVKVVVNKENEIQR